MIIYTAIFGGHDTLRPLPKGMKGVCFTDMPLSVDGWEARAAVFNDESPRMRSRHHKAMSHELFPGETTMWIDGNLSVVALPPECELGAFEHKERIGSISSELAACKSFGKLDSVGLAYAKDRLAGWRASGFKDKGGHPETGCLVRKDTPRVREFNVLWWKHIKECSRDQLSFDYVVWKTGVEFRFLGGTFHKNHFVKWSKHRRASVPKINYIVPFSTKGLVDAYRNAWSLVPEGEWCCFMDMDVMLFGNWGKQIQDVIMACPNYDVYTCKVTRINPRSYRHLHDNRDLMDEHDIRKLYRRAQARSEAFYGKVESCPMDIAGYFMLFRKGLVRDVPFPQDRVKPGRRILGVDSAWSKALDKAGKKCCVMRGLLAVHFYRLGLSSGEHIRWLESVVEPREKEDPPPSKPRFCPRKFRVIPQ